EQDVYGSGLHAGEHGGLGLAEVVTPFVLIGSDELHRQLPDDPALRRRPWLRPEWWHLEYLTSITQQPAKKVVPPAPPQGTLAFDGAPQTKSTPKQKA